MMGIFNSAARPALIAAQVGDDEGVSQIPERCRYVALECGGPCDCSRSRRKQVLARQWLVGTLVGASLVLLRCGYRVR